MAKLSWGMIGGGAGSQIGPVHRMAARLDGAFELVAGALDIDPQAAREEAKAQGIAAERAYGHWRELVAGERGRLDLVTVATPNASHFEITHALLDAGFNVLCEKPLAMSVDEAESIVRLARERDRICAVNYGYTGYPLVRQMRAMVEAGDLGAVRLVFATFAHGHHGSEDDRDNPRVRWRYEPAQAGLCGVLGDAGIHALNLACFVTGQEIARLSADFASCVGGRALEDDALLAFRTDQGAVGRLWTSAVAIGRQHGLSLQVFGERGGLSWAQEHPDQLYWTPLGGRTSIIERGESGLAVGARAASRIAPGHAEGMPLAFANLYRDLADAILARREGRAVPRAPSPTALYPTAEDGLRSLAALDAAARSAASAGVWVAVEVAPDLS